MVKNQKGVTLVELLIVIVILGIIAAISVPAVGNIVTNANKDAVLADATNLQSQVDLYCTSEDDDICEIEDGANDTYSLYFEEGATGTDEYTLDEYIDLGDDITYVVWYDGNEWLVAIETGDYLFAGNPQDASRDSVDDVTDVASGELLTDVLATTDPTSPGAFNDIKTTE